MKKHAFACMVLAIAFAMGCVASAGELSPKMTLTADNEFIQRAEICGVCHNAYIPMTRSEYDTHYVKVTHYVNNIIECVHEVVCYDFFLVTRCSSCGAERSKGPVTEHVALYTCP